MSLLSVAELRRVVQSDRSNSDLQALIDQEEGEVVRRFGPHGDGTTTITEVRSGGGFDIFLARPAASVSSVAERRLLEGADLTLAASAYLLWPGQGRLTRLPQGTAWGQRVTVVYAPADDRAKRKQVITELVRLALEQTALAAESVAGEYSYTAPQWEAVRTRLYRRLKFEAV